MWLRDLLKDESFYRFKLSLLWLLAIVIVLQFTSFNYFKRLIRIWRRKIFHILAVVMFSFPIMDQNLHTFMILAFGVAVAMFIHLEIIRCDRTFVLLFPQFLHTINKYFQDL